MTLIRPFKVTEGQSDHTIRFASNEFLFICSIVIIALSRPETLFSADDLDLTFQGLESQIKIQGQDQSKLPRSPKVKLITPSDLERMSSYICSIVTIALSRTETLFFSDSLDLIGDRKYRSHNSFSNVLTSQRLVQLTIVCIIILYCRHKLIQIQTKTSFFRRAYHSYAS